MAAVSGCHGHRHHCRAADDRGSDTVADDKPPPEDPPAQGGGNHHSDTHAAAAGGSGPVSMATPTLRGPSQRLPRCRLLCARPRQARRGRLRGPARGYPGVPRAAASSFAAILERSGRVRGARRRGAGRGRGARGAGGRRASRAGRGLRGAGGGGRGMAPMRGGWCGAGSAVLTPRLWLQAAGTSAAPPCPGGESPARAARPGATRGAQAAAPRRLPGGEPTGCSLK